MKLFKTLALTAMFALVASPALAEDPEIVTIYKYSHVTLSTTNNCLATVAQTDDACDNLALNQINVARSFYMTNIRTTVDVAGDASSTCDLFPEVAATAVGNEETAFSVVTLGAVFNEAQGLNVIEGALFAVNISDASGCYDNTAPVVSVWIEGFYTGPDFNINSHTPTAR